MGVLSRRRKPKVPEPAEEELMEIRRPSHTWRVLCKYDPSFPEPDPEFINTLAEHRVIVPLNQLQGKRPPEERRIEAEVLQYARKKGWATKPEELAYFPMHNPLYTIGNTIHGRSAHTETPVELVRVVPEYTFKGPGDRKNPSPQAFSYSPYEDLRERRWRGFALAQTTRHAVNVSLAVHNEFDFARNEGDPIVTKAMEGGFTEAPTLKYGCVVKPLQTLVDVRDIERYLEGSFGEVKLFTPEEEAMIRRRGPGVYPINRGSEVNLFLDLRGIASDILVSTLESYMEGGEKREDAVKAITDDKLISLTANDHNIQLQVEGNALTLIDRSRDKEITPQQAIDLIQARKERMLAEKDTLKEDMVLFGYTVPFQVRMHDLARMGGDIKYDSKECEDYITQWRKTFKWYGLNLDVDKRYRLSITDEQGKKVGVMKACKQLMDKFTEGCALDYHLVVNRMNGSFSLESGSATIPQNFLSCAHFVDNDTVHLHHPTRDPEREKKAREEFGVLIFAMNTSLKGLVMMEEARHPVRTYFNLFTGVGSWFIPDEPTKHIQKFNELADKGLEYVESNPHLRHRKYPKDKRTI